MVLAPQLRQSLELLQVPVMELRALVRQELEQNPVLEERPLDSINIELEEKAPEIEDSKELDFQKEFETLSRLDEEWRGYFMQDYDAEPFDSARQKKRDFFFDSLIQQVSLQDHLLNQLSLSDLSEEDRRLGELVIGNINDDGYLLQAPEDLAKSVGTDTERVRDILATIQDMDPVGVGAADLKECLMLQLERIGHQDPLAIEIVSTCLGLLGHKKYKEIAHTLKAPLENVHQAAKLISTLEPKPGRLFTSESTAYVMPDIVVKKVEGKYIVILNDDQLPRLRISKHYKQVMNEESSAQDVKNYVRDRIRAGLFLIKSISQRQQTLFKVATEIVNVQSNFFEEGISGLKPLTMTEVAERVGIHETTVCRTIANKYMKTPSGLFEMKYFFTPGLKTMDGQSISNRSAKDMLAALVSGEDPEKPFSDIELVEKLKEQGLNIARRTVAKYRLELRIPPSHLRK